MNDNRPATHKTNPPHPTVSILTTLQTNLNRILPASATRITRKHAEGRFLLESASCLLLTEPLYNVDLTLLASGNRNHCLKSSESSFTLQLKLLHRTAC
jgi:hypothetical protein